MPEWTCVKPEDKQGCVEEGWTVTICGTVYTEEGVQLQNANLGGSADCIAYEWYDYCENSFESTVLSFDTFGVCTMDRCR